MIGVSRGIEGNKITLNTSIYSLVAIKKAAYKFADRAAICLNTNAGNGIEAIFSFAGHEGSNQEEVISDFYNELLDQDLRELIKQETAPIRNLILAHAFSRTSLIPAE